MKNAQAPPASAGGAYTVKSLVKALNILEALAEGEESAYTLTQLSRRLHLHISTVHRLLVNLVRQGFVEEAPGSGGYQLSFKVLRMGLRVLDRLDFRLVAQPLLRELNQQTKETVHLAILQETRAVSIDKFGSPQPVGLDARLGGVMPLHCTGVGKILLAYQSEDLLNQMARTHRLSAFHSAHHYESGEPEEGTGADSRARLRAGPGRGCRRPALRGRAGVRSCRARYRGFQRGRTRCALDSFALDRNCPLGSRHQPADFLSPGIPGAGG